VPSHFSPLKTEGLSGFATGAFLIAEGDRRPVQREDFVRIAFVGR
jgi:hypothetical protein